MSQKQHEYRIAHGTNNAMQHQILTLPSEDTEDEEVLPSKPSKLEQEGGFLSRIFKKKKSRTLSKHNVTSSRGETVVKQKIQAANTELEKRKTLPKEEPAKTLEPGAPLLTNLAKSLNCGLSEPLPTRSREDFSRSLVQMREALADNRKNYLDDMNQTSAGGFVTHLAASGDVLKANGKADEGLEYFLEAIQICRKYPSLKENLAGILNDVGLLHCDLQNYKEAKKSLLESHAILLDVHGDVYPDVAVSAGNLGIAYCGCKENSASSDMIGNAIKAMEAIYGKDHEYTLQQRGLLGASLLTAGDASEARKELRAVTARMRHLSIYSDGHPFLRYLELELQLAQQVASN